MKIPQNIFLVVAAIFVVLAEQSEGNTSILASLSESTQVEKIVTDPEFQRWQEEIIMAGTDMDSLAARATIEDIRKKAQQFPVYKVNQLAVILATNGVVEAVILINHMARQANKAIDNASNLVKAQDTEGATAAIKNGMTSDRELVFIAGVPIHDAQGCALVMAGGSAGTGLKNTIKSIQKAGSAIFEAIQIAMEISTAGIKAGGRAAEEAFQSARNIILTGTLSVYKNLDDAALHALEGLQFAADSKTNNDVDGIKASLREEISNDTSPAALAAIATLTDDLKSVLSVLTNKTAIDAANVMYEGIRSTILETSDSISIAKKAIKLAGTLDLEAAVAAVINGIKEARDKMLSGSAKGYLGSGAAGQIAGKAVAERLVPAVLEIEYGRVAAYEDLKLAERTAVLGILGGELAKAQGMFTALEICDAAGQTLYQDYAYAGKIGFEVLKDF